MMEDDRKLWWAVEFTQLDTALLKGIISIWEYNEYHLNYFEEME